MKLKRQIFVLLSFVFLNLYNSDFIFAQYSGNSSGSSDTGMETDNGGYTDTTNQMDNNST